MQKQGAANALIEELYINQRTITHRILTSDKPLDQLFMEDGTLAKDVINMAAVEAILFDLMNASTVDFAMMTVMNRQLRLLAQAA